MYGPAREDEVSKQIRSLTSLAREHCVIVEMHCTIHAPVLLSKCVRRNLCGSASCLMQ